MNTEIQSVRDLVKCEQIIHLRESHLSLVETVKLCVGAVNSAVLMRGLNVDFLGVVLCREELLFVDILGTDVLATQVKMLLSAVLSEGFWHFKVVEGAIHGQGPDCAGFASSVPADLNEEPGRFNFLGLS